MQGVWRSKKWGWRPDPTLYPILTTLVPIVGAAVSFFAFTSVWALAHNPEVQILGSDVEPYLKNKPQEHFVSRRKSIELHNDLNKRMDANTKPANEEF